MGSRKIRKYWTIMDGDVLNRVTVYKYGKVFAPRMNRRSVFITESPTDRPGLISKIHHLLQVHSAQRMISHAHKKKCCQVLHKALWKAIRMCFELNISESKLFPVKDLFLELLYCDGNLSSIFSILLTKHVTHPAVNVLYNNEEQENCKAFDYYLHHISTLQIEEFGESKGSPLDIINHEIDSISNCLPISAAVTKRDPSLVLSLLRHGADPLRADRSLGTSPDDEIDLDPTEQLIDDLNGFVLFKNTGFTDTTKAILATEEKKAWACFSYFLRSAPSIFLSASSHIITGTDDGNEEDRYVEPNEPDSGRKTYHIHPLVATSLNMDHFKQTPKLMHICRCAIRQNIKQLNQHSLPSAIQQLPLPTVLKDYLDLQLE